MDRRTILMNQCGLPINDSTSHCFNDFTHQTCCMLGPKAREYSNNSGNPIGYISEKLNPNKNLTPWCTCSGSGVCSYYANKFNDSTHIKFINDNNNGIIYDFEKDKNLNEYDVVNKIGISKHRTPGIYWEKINKNF